MSMCRVFSCVIGRRCSLWPVRSLGKTLLAFAFSYCSWISQGKNPEVVCHSLLQRTTFCLFHTLSLIDMKAWSGLWKMIQSSMISKTIVFSTFWDYETIILLDLQFAVPWWGFEDCSTNQNARGEIPLGHWNSSKSLDKQKQQKTLNLLKSNGPK